MHHAIVKYNDIPIKQLICDLNWVAKSPALLAIAPPQVSWSLLSANYFSNCADWLIEIEKHPADLIAFFDSGQQFILGKYFEKHLGFIFKYFEGVSLIASGLQVEMNKRTIGEIDFVLKHLTSGKITQLEVAVKYYMGYGASAKHTMWIGPNGMDNLEGKIQKFSTQLSMAGFSQQLADLNPATFEKKVLLKGYFFKHISSKLLPHFNNQVVLTGKWLYISELGKTMVADSTFMILPKRYWLGFCFDKNLERYSGTKIVEAVHSEIQRVGKGILMAELDEEAQRITTKYMVVPDYWPKLKG